MFLVGSCRVMSATVAPPPTIRNVHRDNLIRQSSRASLDPGGAHEHRFFAQALGLSSLKARRELSDRWLYTSSGGREAPSSLRRPVPTP